MQTLEMVSYGTVTDRVVNYLPGNFQDSFGTRSIESECGSSHQL